MAKHVYENKLEENLFKRFLIKIRDSLILFSKNKKAVFGAIIMLFFLFMLVVLTRIMPFDSSVDPFHALEPPSMDHWFGTDDLGRDILRRLVAGSRSVLSIAFLTGLFSIFLGVVLGLVSGLVGGWVDKVIMMISNLFLTVPSFPIMLALASVLTISNSLYFALLLSVWSWAGLARAIRSQVISIKERDFIQICKVMNLSNVHVIFREIMPNIASYIAVNFIMIMRNAITASVGIMMLGVASYDPTNWGAMLNNAQAFIINKDAVMLWLSPILFITLFQCGVVCLANGLDEVLNPRLRKL